MEHLGKTFWTRRYEDNLIGWDIGRISTPLKTYIDQLNVEDKNKRILLPGAGNGYEAIYLVQQGFSNVTVIDLAKPALDHIKKAIKEESIQLIEGDFFDHVGTYDLILEQTFFCAIDPSLREKYAQQMKTLLEPNGKLVGVYFNRLFDKPGPPFGGLDKDYKALFENYFTHVYVENCYNSIVPRAGRESFIICSY